MFKQCPCFGNWRPPASYDTNDDDAISFRSASHFLRVIKFALIWGEFAVRIKRAADQNVMCVTRWSGAARRALKVPAVVNNLRVAIDNSTPPLRLRCRRYRC
jgi:hypothetical protein